MKSVLVTGACGFIGSNLVSTIRTTTEDIQVTGVDNLSNGFIEFFPKNKGNELWICDFTSTKVLDAVSQGKFDAVIHLAALPRVSYSVENPLKTHYDNVTKTLELMESCKISKTRFVFASSSSVYGNESSSLSPKPGNQQSPYALQKFVIDQHIELYKRLYDFNGISLRFFNVFGPNQLGSSPYACAVSAWLTAIKKNLPIRFDGDGTQRRDMTYVANVANACIKAMLSSSREQCNIGCGTNISNNEILQLLRSRYDNFEIKNAPIRAGDVKVTLADITVARDNIGYEPTVSFEEGFHLTCDWYDAHWDEIKDLKLGV